MAQKATHLGHPDLQAHNPVLHPHNEMAAPPPLPGQSDHCILTQGWSLCSGNRDRDSSHSCKQSWTVEGSLETNEADLSGYEEPEAQRMNDSSMVGGGGGGSLFSPPGQEPLLMACSSCVSLGSLSVAGGSVRKGFLNPGASVHPRDDPEVCSSLCPWLPCPGSSCIRPLLAPGCICTLH